MPWQSRSLLSPTFPPSVHPYFPLAPRALFCSPLLRSESAYRITLAGGSSLGYLLITVLATQMNHFVIQSTAVSAIKMKALHQWFSEPCPDQHCLQTWHILRFFPSPTEPENSGVEPNTFVLKYDNHCSTIPQTSSSTLTMNYCPDFLLLSEKKIKNQRGLCSLGTTEPTTICHQMQLYTLKLVPPLGDLVPSSLLLMYTTSLVLHSLIRQYFFFNWIISTSL